MNPAVTIGALLAGRISLGDAIGYWVAQFVGGVAGALVLWAMFAQSPMYHRSVQGLGTDGYAGSSLIHLSAGGAFLAEVILTALFVFVILGVTSKVGNAATAGVVIGLTLTVVHLIGIPLTGTSVEPRTQPRPGSGHRRDRPEPGVALRPGAPGRRGAGGGPSPGGLLGRRGAGGRLTPPRPSLAVAAGVAPVPPGS